MTVVAARVPSGLGEEGRRLWRSIASQVAEDGPEMDQRELNLLRSAAREADMLTKIESALEGQPMTVHGAQGQMVAHPLLGEARRSRSAIASLLKQLSLVDPGVAVDIGRGGRTTSTQARDAANIRHRGAR